MLTEVGEDVLKSHGAWGNDMESPRRWVQPPLRTTRHGDRPGDCGRVGVTLLPTRRTSATTPGC